MTPASPNTRRLLQTVVPVLVGCGVLLGTGCATNRPSPANVGERSHSEAIRVNAYALLHDLLTDQANVDKLLLIKLESDPLEALVDDIASQSTEALEQLETFEREDPRIDLQLTGLPPGELAVRKSIAATKRERLLEPFNPEFETELLRTQLQALSYAWHLAQVTAEHEDSAARRAFLTTFGANMRSLHDQALALLSTQ